MKQLRILILSDDHFARRGLATLLNGEEGYLVVASHESTVDLAESLVTYRPDLLLWDLGWDPEDALARLSHYVGPDDDDEDGDEDSNTTIDSRNQNDLLPIVALIAEAAQSRDLPRRNIQGVLLRDAPVAQLTSALNDVSSISRKGWKSLAIL